MPFGGKKANGFNLDCVLGNIAVTVVTCCGYVFQGTIEDEEYTRAQYGYPLVFPTVTMDLPCEDKEEDKKDGKKEHCPKPVDMEVQCQSSPKFICLRLTAQPGNICCPVDPSVAGTAGFSYITPIAGTGGGTPSIFLEDDTVLINVNDIVAIGPSRPNLTPV